METFFCDVALTVLLKGKNFYSFTSLKIFKVRNNKWSGFGLVSEALESKRS